MMEHFIETILELLFSFTKKKPEQMPDIVYQSTFIVKYNPKGALIRMILSLIGTIAVTVMAYIGGGLSFALLFAIPGTIIVLLFVFEFSYKCTVCEDTLKPQWLFFFPKVISWNDVVRVGVIEKTGTSSVTIALYNQDEKTMIEFCSPMENMWYVVKMAERKGIEIKPDTYLDTACIS